MVLRFTVNDCKDAVIGKFNSWPYYHENLLFIMIYLVDVSGPVLGRVYSFVSNVMLLILRSGHL